MRLRLVVGQSIREQINARNDLDVMVYIRLVINPYPGKPLCLGIYIISNIFVNQSCIIIYEVNVPISVLRLELGVHDFDYRFFPALVFP